MGDAEPVVRGEFHAGMQAMRDAITGLEKQIVERTSRIEGKQDAAAAAQLGAAREVGRTDARLDALERQHVSADARFKAQDVRIWALVLVALGAVLRLLLGLVGAGVR